MGIKKVCAVSGIKDVQCVELTPSLMDPKTDLFFFNLKIRLQVFSGSLFCPFMAGENKNISNPKYFNEVKLHNQKWLANYGLKDQKKAEFIKLVTMCFRDPDKESMKLILDFASWLFAYDDNRDKKDSDIGNSVDLTKKVTSYFLKGFRASKLPADLDVKNGKCYKSLCASLVNISQRMDAQEFEKFHFDQTLARYFKANEWEAMNRGSDEIPSPNDYKDHREDSSAVHCAFEIAFMTLRLNLTDEVRNDQSFQRMWRYATYSICFINDLGSYESESQEGVAENLVSVIQENERLQGRDISLKQAIQRTVHEQNNVVKSFLNHKQIFFDGQFKDNKDAIQAIKIMEDWMSGNRDFTCYSKRYTMALATRSTL